MPVKVKCPKCDKVINAPEAARGKAIKCPSCESRVPVPVEGEAPSASAKPAAASKTAKPAVKPVKAKKAASDDDDFLNLIDSERIEDQSIRLCPKCGARLWDEEETECPECGTDTRTGQLTARRKRKLSLKGADPAEFYRAAWVDSWVYLKEHLGLAVRLAGLWSAFVVLITICYYGLRVWCSYTIEYPANALEPLTSLHLAVLYAIPLYGDTPPQIFWKCLALVIYLGFPGTYWSISQQIIAGTLDSRDKPFKVAFEVVTSVALGIKSIVWQIVLVLPVFWSGVADILPILVFPIAMVHMTRPYAHPAWIAVDMARIFWKNIGQTLYWLMMAFVTHLPAALIIGLGALFFPSHILPAFQGWASSLATWLAGMCGETAAGGFMYGMFHPVISFTFTALVAICIFPLVSFPSVFMMRANGLLGYFCKNQLDLIGKIPKHAPAGFWPRWLAFLIDAFCISLLMLLIPGALMGLAYAAFINDMAAYAYPLMGLANLTGLAIQYFYFVRGECSAMQGTLGKRALGLVVTDMKGNRIKPGAALMRFLIRNVVPGGLLGTVMIPFTEKQQAMHDSMTKTLVVWEGD